MTRRVVLSPDDVARVRRDSRYRQALANRRPIAGWRSTGNCVGSDPELFFPAPTEDPRPALGVCRTCAVRGACLAAALESGEAEGVWGGTTPEERRVMRVVWRTMRAEERAAERAAAERAAEQAEASASVPIVLPAGETCGPPEPYPQEPAGARPAAHATGYGTVTLRPARTPVNVSR
jgi:hypothetical protein